jgi:hypothetical protein
VISTINVTFLNTKLERDAKFEDSNLIIYLQYKDKEKLQKNLNHN